MKSNIPNIKTSQIYPKFKIHIYVKTDCQNRQLRNFTNKKTIIIFFSCPRDHSIEIVNGNYGRFTITLCNNKVTPSHCLCFVLSIHLTKGAQNWSVNCYLESAMAHMAGSCNGRQSCSISEKAFTLNQDSCPGTERYLEAHYKCTPDKGEL